MASHPLKSYRKNLQLTQEELARQFDVTRTTVARWETGRRKIDDELLSKVSKITGISRHELRPDLDELLSGSPRAGGALA